MFCGIYLGSPKSGKTHKVYVGQSIDIVRRVQRHNRDMLNGTARQKIQEAFNLYGEFDWEVLIECSEASLDSEEAKYIKLFNSVNEGFNTYEDACCAPILCGIKNGRVTKDVIDITNAVISLTLANPTYSRYQIADILDIKAHSVAHIWYGSTNTWIQEVLPNEYLKLKELQGTRHVGGKTAEQQGIVYPAILNPELEESEVLNVREFARLNNLDSADLLNVLNIKTASVKGWIIKDLDRLNPEMHSKFYSTKRGYYKRQFDLYKNNY